MSKAAGVPPGAAVPATARSDLAGALPQPPPARTEGGAGATGPLAVLYVSNFADAIGGGEESLLELIRELPRTAVRPILVVPARGEIAGRAERAGLPVEVVPMPSLKPLPGWRNIVPVRSLAAILARHAVDLVHANGSRAMLYAGLAALRERVPALWHVRIVDRDPWLDGLLLRLAAAVITNSRATAGRFARRTGAAGKVHVIPNGVNLARIRPGAPDAGLQRALGLGPEGPVIAFAGRLEHGKGPDLLLEAAVGVQRERRDAQWLFVGDGPMRPALEARALAAGLPAIFAARRQDLLPVLHLCAALVVPSRQEAFGRVVIEAMAAEVPVVATRVGGIPEVCLDGRTGLLVPPEDPAALAAAILATLGDADATRARVRAAAEDVRARFSLTDHARQVEQVYRALIRRAEQAPCRA
jgi:glycosyltransferase involved in cell wall biosynthesis